jgi:hypothetical protein
MNRETAYNRGVARPSCILNTVTGFYCSRLTAGMQLKGQWNGTLREPIDREGNIMTRNARVIVTGYYVKSW